MQRLAIRTTNAYSLASDELLRVLHDLETVEPQLGEWPGPGAVETLVNVLRQQVAKQAASEERSKQVPI